MLSHLHHRLQVAREECDATANIRHPIYLSAMPDYRPNGNSRTGGIAKAKGNPHGHYRARGSVSLLYVTRKITRPKSKIASLYSNIDITDTVRRFAPSRLDGARLRTGEGAQRSRLSALSSGVSAEMRNIQPPRFDRKLRSA